MDYFLDSLVKIGTNRYLLVPVCAMLAAQLLKVVISAIKDRRFDSDVLFGTGRMPSSHSAFVCSLTTLVGLHEGFDSVLFAASTVFSCIIMYDASGVRLQAGKQAQMLNVIIDLIKEKHSLKSAPLKEFLGHTPFEVYAGALLGIVIGILFR